MHTASLANENTDQEHHVLILGADTFQIGLICFLNGKGYKTHVVTNRASDPGIKLAHYWHDFSYAEEDKLILLFKKINAIQIFCVASDAALIYQSFIQDKFRLNGNSLKFIAFFTDKLTYKTTYKKQIPNHFPAIEQLKNKTQLLEFYNRSGLDGIILKPRKGSGSQEIIYLNLEREVKKHELPQLPSNYIVEEFIKGEEMGGDFLVYNGFLTFYWPTIKKTNRYLVPTSHLILRNNKYHSLISKFLSLFVETSHLPNGIYNVDIIVKNNVPFIIDLSPRMGGNCIPNLIYLSTGINTWEFITELLIQNISSSKIEIEWKCPHGVYILGANDKGIIDTITTTTHPFGSSIVEVFWKVQNGDGVLPFNQGGRHIGYILYKASTDEELLSLEKKIESFSWFTVI